MEVYEMMLMLVGAAVFAVGYFLGAVTVAAGENIKRKK